MNLIHHHLTRSADALRQLRVSDDTRTLFTNYFADGLSPAQAISLHASKLMVITK